MSSWVVLQTRQLLTLHRTHYAVWFGFCAYPGIHSKQTLLLQDSQCIEHNSLHVLFDKSW